MVCPGSVALTAAVPDRETEAAARGRACHAALAALLQHRALAFAEAGLTDEEKAWVNQAAQWIRLYVELQEGRAVMHVESRAEVGRVFGCPDELWGTADVAVVGAAKLLVVDAKFGWEDVAILGNPQVSLYAIGFAELYGWRHDTYELGIVQPRSTPPVSLEVLTRAQLQDRRDRYRHLVTAALEVPAPLVATDDGCRWCPALAVCPEAQARAAVLAQRAYMKPAMLTVRQLAEVLSGAKMLRRALDAAEEYALKTLELGGEIPGWKRVLTKAHRQWKDIEEAEKVLSLLGDRELWTRTFISPAQAEKLFNLRQKALDALAPSPPGGPTLVRDSDPRPALDPAFKPVK